MSRRYEFLEDGAKLVVDPEELADEFEGDVAYGHVALVLGNPYATASVLCGTRESIAATLREWLVLVE